MSKTRFAFFAGQGLRRSSGVQEEFETLEACGALFGAPSITKV
jgi:hypothetical protein